MDTTSSIALALGVLLNHRRSSIRACVLAILLPLSLVEFVLRFHFWLLFPLRASHAPWLRLLAKD